MIELIELFLAIEAAAVNAIHLQIPVPGLIVDGFLIGNENLLIFFDFIHS